MSDRSDEAYRQLCAFRRQTAVLASIESLLDWDDRCIRPPAAADYRAEQTTLLAGLVHQRRTDPRIADWLAEVEAGEAAADPASEVAANVRQLRRDYDRAVRVPQSLVEEITRTSVLGQQAWEEARAANDFAHFRPLLARMIELKRQEAEALGYNDQPYDALLDGYEPAALTRDVAMVLSQLRDQLTPLIGHLVGCARRPQVEILQRHYPIDVQRQFGRRAAEQIGFDFHRGRLDETSHPFCTDVGPDDCRITTRYDERQFSGGFFGILHEAGHGIYEQGLPGEHYGLPLGEAVSLGIHESQSRLWENVVGRGGAFWSHFYPLAQQAYPAALADVPRDEFLFAVNDVRPSLIRTEADEATYNLHILIRFELELELISGNLPVDDLPAAWNDRYRQYLGIDPPNDADGVLQDIHWSAGLFGYFPTYSLGNLYAAQFMAAAEQQLGNLDEAFAGGDFRPLLDWLRENVHRHGRRYTASELVVRVTGSPLSHAPLIDYLHGKYDRLYQEAGAAPPPLPTDANGANTEVVADSAEPFYEYPPSLPPQANGDLTTAPEAAAAGSAPADEEPAGSPIEQPWAGPVGEQLALETPDMSGFEVDESESEGSPVLRRPRQQMSMTTFLIGYLASAIIGTSIGYVILLMITGRQGDFLGLLDMLPSWVTGG